MAGLGHSLEAWRDEEQGLAVCLQSSLWHARRPGFPLQERADVQKKRITGHGVTTSGTWLALQGIHQLDCTLRLVAWK